MAYAKLTPQEQRRSMIDAMNSKLFNATKDDREVDIQIVIENFMYEHGSSKTRTKEYFDLVVNVTSRDPSKRYYYDVIDGKVSRFSKEEPKQQPQQEPQQQPHP